MTGAAAGALGLFAAAYPGGKFTVKYFPTGYVEVQSALVVDPHAFDPDAGVARRFQAEAITTASSAVMMVVIK